MSNVLDDQKNSSESGDHINLTVVGPDSSKVQFKIRKETPFKKLMKAYCDRAGLGISEVRFRFEGHPLRDTDTPWDTGVEDGDTIEIFKLQEGGLRANLIFKS